VSKVSHSVFWATNEEQFVRTLDSRVEEGWEVVAVWQDGNGQYKALLRRAERGSQDGPIGP
jgi:hypothetical protein